MSYRIFFLRRAQKELADLPDPIYGRIKQTAAELASDPWPRHSQKLRSREGLRIRVGSYRIIYKIDDTLRTVTILQIGHRSDVYR